MNIQIQMKCMDLGLKKLIQFLVAISQTTRDLIVKTIQD